MLQKIEACDYFDRVQEEEEEEEEDDEEEDDPVDDVVGYGIRDELPWLQPL